MPLGIITDESEELVESSVAIEQLKRGRGEGKKNTPDEVRKIIQEVSITNGRSRGIDLAKQFGLSPSSVDAYKSGSNGLGQPKNPDLVNQLNKIKAEIAESAAKKARAAISHITADKMKDLSANKAAILARDLASVTKSMSPEDDQTGSVGPNFIVYAPQMKSEKAFEVVDLGEEG